jgi:hypothetical protein
MSTSKEVSEYCVLYYKRKNGKKHSSKGVSKLDGSLRVCGKQVTLVCDDSGEVVCRKILSELGQRELEADEVLKLGAFEVQVFQKTVDVNSNQSIASLASLPPQKSTKLKKTFLKRRPLHPSRPPLPEKPSTNPEAISTFREEKQNLVLKKLKRPLLSSFTLSRPKLRKRSPIQETKITNMFPNAVGSIDVPHSIQKVLKSHQISGVEFLWNCLSGDQKGAILADEMGLGKTLMTIAVICALHRQKRDRVSPLLLILFILVGNQTNHFSLFSVCKYARNSWWFVLLHWSKIGQRSLTSGLAVPANPIGPLFAREDLRQPKSSNAICNGVKF